MAYTSIHGIKTTLNKALDYIENPEKTEEQLLVSGYNVDPLCAAVEYRMTAALAREIKGDYSSTGGADNLAYHMIQSFAPYDKITPDAAHELGKKWADEILGGKYEYVISTHVDKGHIHNHIIFNAVSFYDYKKFDNYKIAGHLREVSDRLCAEQGLFVIQNPNLRRKSPSHYEWEQNKKGTSWKAKIKDSIDRAILECSDFNGFQEYLKKEGIEILPEARLTFHVIGVKSKNGRAGKCRGDKIGNDYTKARILERLAAPEKNKMVAKPEKTNTPMPYDKRVEFEARKTKLAKTKELAAALLTIRAENIQQDSDFTARISDLTEKAADVRSTMTELTEKNQQYKDAAKYLLAIKEYALVKEQLDKQSLLTKKKFAGQHESELAAYDHAVAQLERMGVNTNVDPDKVLGLVKAQDGKVYELSDALRGTTKRIEDLRQAQRIVEQIKAAQVQETEKKKAREEER